MSGMAAGNGETGGLEGDPRGWRGNPRGSWRMWNGEKGDLEQETLSKDP